MSIRFNMYSRYLAAIVLGGLAVVFVMGRGCTQHENEVDEWINVLASVRVKNEHPRDLSSEQREATGQLLELLELDERSLDRVLRALEEGSDVLKFRLIRGVLNGINLSVFPRDRAQQHDEKITHSLLTCLNNSNPLVRIEAAEALANRSTAEQTTLAHFILYSREFHSNPKGAESLLDGSVGTIIGLSKDEEFGEAHLDYPQPRVFALWWMKHRHEYPKQLLPTGWDEAEVLR